MIPRHRSIGLDVLRAVAVLMVLIRHSTPCPPAVSAWGHAVWAHLQMGGWAGVDLFFVLSGFLVGGLLFREYRETGALDFKRFFIRRGCKIYPPFWIFLCFIVVWKICSGAPVDNLPAELFFYQNYVRAVWGTNWSLAVEEHFYVLLPCVLLGLASRRVAHPFDRLPRLFGYVSVVCLALRTWNSSNPYDTYTHLTPTHLRIDGLFFGALLAYFHTYQHERFVGLCRRWRWWLLAGGIAAFLPANFLPLEDSIYLQSAGFAVQWLGAGALIGFALSRTTAPGKMARAFAAIGRTSYATYLWHFWIGFHGLPGLAAWLGVTFSWPAATASYLVASLGTGFLLTAAIEGPCLRWRDRRFPHSARLLSVHVG